MFKLVLSTLVLALATVTSADKFGNYYNYWIRNGVNFDLTRSGSANPKTIATFSHGHSNITIAPERTCLVIIDMQNYFLDPSMDAAATGGRAAVAPTLKLIDAFRKNGMPICWVQWGLTEYDLIHQTPSFIFGFSDGEHANTTFGSEMGIYNSTYDGMVDAGRLLWRGSWNAQAWGPLYTAYLEGAAAGTDFYFNKNRLSGLWGKRTPFEIWLNDNSMTTLFFGGVNADQCVFGTMIDAVFKGYDTIYVEDISATTSPYYATEMVVYNIGSDGWTTNSTQILAALA